MKTHTYTLAADVIQRIRKKTLKKSAQKAILIKKNFFDQKIYVLYNSGRNARVL